LKPQERHLLLLLATTFLAQTKVLEAICEY